MTEIPHGTDRARRRSILGVLDVMLRVALVVEGVFWLGIVTAKADDIKRSYGLTLFAGRLLDNDWEDTFWPPNVGFREPYLAGVGLSRRLGDAFELLDFEFEGQVVYRFHGENLFEFNFPVVGRFSQFPWRDTVPTSFAFGLGLSYTTEKSAAERAHRGDTERLLAYWFGEIEVGLPDAPWSGLVRLHHRSTAFGAFGDDGGSNWLLLGIRRRF
jgi:hypothetical protein